MTAIPLSPQRLKPPPDLSETERDIWAELVGSLPREHFLPSDAPLVAELCVAIAQARDAARHLREEGPVVGRHVSPWLIVQEKSTRTLLALATRLRLSPQARARVKVQSSGPVSFYDKMKLMERDNAGGA
jgi:P27 family predicted phage terminase small subunit